MAHDDPQSRNEAILTSILDKTEYTEEAQSRIEALLIELKDAIETGGSGHEYSETEKEVGTWIDGSPVYEITFTGTVSTSPTSVTDLSELDVDTIIDISGMLINTEEEYGYRMMLSGYVNSDNTSGIYIPKDGRLLLYFTGNYQDYIITVRYTKIPEA